MTAYSGTSGWRRCWCGGHAVFGNSALKCTIFSTHASFCFTSWWIKWVFKQTTDEAFGLNTTNNLLKFSFLCAILSFHTVSLRCYFCEVRRRSTMSDQLLYLVIMTPQIWVTTKLCEVMQMSTHMLKKKKKLLFGMDKGIIWKGNEAPEQCFHTVCCFLWCVSAEDECGSVQNTSNFLC